MSGLTVAACAMTACRHLGWTVLRTVLAGVALAAAVLSDPARAAVACAASSSGLTVGFYDTASASATRTSGTVTVSCTRTDLINDPATAYVALGVNSGLSPSGDMSRARLAGGTNQDTLDYWLWRDAAGSLVWTDKQGTSGTRLLATLAFGTGATATQSVTYYATVPPITAQTRSPAKGTYDDTQTMSLYLSTVSSSDAAKASKAASTATFPVRVTVPENCVLSSPPGSLSFSYTSFQAAAANASTSFAVTCVTNVPYSLALDATAGTLAGLDYTLSLSATSGTGTGLPQAASINGSIGGGQSGVCAGASCSASAQRTLTITY